jgi:S1-C subfamily serine protease
MSFPRLALSTILFLVVAVPTTQAGEEREKARAELRQIAAEANRLSRAFNLVHQIVGPSVVSIHTKETVRFANYWTGRVTRREVDMGEGSGFIIHSDDKYSYILTNSHVVLQTNQQQEFLTGPDQQPVRYDRVRVTLNDKRDADAEYVGYYPQSDLAVLKIAIPKLPAIEWADSDQVHVGDWVVALGYPFAVGFSATTGIVSATDRSTGIYSSSMAGGFDNFIQTDAAINPGNSGGALVDLQGRVIGVNSNIISRSGGNVGLGFAIPSNHARRIAEDLITHGHVRRSVIGINLAMPAKDDPAYDPAKDPDRDLVKIAEVVPDSPAAAAGLKPGDVVLSIDQFRVTSPQQFQSRMSSYRIGVTVPLTVKRDNKELVVQVVPIAMDDLYKRLDKAAGDTATRRGVELRGFGLAVATDDRPGLVITDLDPDGVAMAAGLEIGDRLLHERSVGALRTLDDARQLDKLR